MVTIRFPGIPAELPVMNWRMLLLKFDGGRFPDSFPHVLPQHIPAFPDMVDLSAQSHYAIDNGSFFLLYEQCFNSSLFVNYLTSPSYAELPPHSRLYHLGLVEETD